MKSVTNLFCWQQKIYWKDVRKAPGHWRKAWNMETCLFFDGINNWAILILVALNFVSVVYLRIKLRNTKSEKCYIVQEVRDETGDYFFSYISVYLLSCIGLSLSNIFDVFVLVFLVGYMHYPWSGLSKFDALYDGVQSLQCEALCGGRNGDDYSL